MIYSSTRSLGGEVGFQLRCLADLSAAASAGVWGILSIPSCRKGCKRRERNVPDALWPQAQVAPVGLVFSVEEREQVQEPAGRCSVTNQHVGLEMETGLLPTRRR